MSHNAYTAGRGGTAGDWLGSTAVTSAEFAWLAKGVFESINGDQGGTWAPASPIIIGGAGVQFTTTIATFYGITCTGNTTLGDASADQLTVNATADFYAAVNFHSGVQFVGGSSGTHATILFGPYADLVLSGAGFTSSGDAEFTGSVTLDGGDGTHPRGLTVGQYYVTTLHGTNTFYGFNVPAGNIIVSDSEARFNGGIRQPIQTITASGAITAGTRYVIANIAAGGYVQLPSSHPTNAVIKIINRSTLSVEVRSPAGTRLFDIQDATASDKWVEMYYDGSSWLDLLDNGIIP